MMDPQLGLREHTDLSGMRLRRLTSEVNTGSGPEIVVETFVEYRRKNRSTFVLELGGRVWYPSFGFNSGKVGLILYSHIVPWSSAAAAAVSPLMGVSSEAEDIARQDEATDE